MKRGEVWRIRLRSVPGHTQSGVRPAVVVQEDQATASLPTVLVVPFTGTQAAARLCAFTAFDQATSRQVAAFGSSEGVG